MERRNKLPRALLSVLAAVSLSAAACAGVNETQQRSSVGQSASALNYGSEIQRRQTRLQILRNFSPECFISDWRSNLRELAGGEYRYPSGIIMGDNPESSPIKETVNEVDFANTVHQTNQLQLHQVAVELLDPLTDDLVGSINIESIQSHNGRLITLEDLQSRAISATYMSLGQVTLEEAGSVKSQPVRDAIQYEGICLEVAGESIALSRQTEELQSKLNLLFDPNTFKVVRP